MDSESVQIHVGKAPDEEEGTLRTPEALLNDVSINLTTATPSTYATPAGSVYENGASIVERGSSSSVTPSTVSVASPQSEWATPAAFDTSVRVYSFAEMISMPTLVVPNGESKGAVKTPEVLTEPKTPSIGADIMNQSVAEADIMNRSVAEADMSPIPSESVSSYASNIMAAPPNTPQTLLDTTLGGADITVYEKTPYGGMTAGQITPSSNDVKIVGSTEKVAQAVTGSDEPQKGTSRTYIVPVDEEPVKSVDVVKASATPFAPDLNVTHALESSVDAVDGPTEPVAEAANGRSQTVVAANGTSQTVVAANGTSQTVVAANGTSQTAVNGFGDDEGLVSEAPDCDDLLGSFLVRPCPSMRPYRRTFAKVFLVGLLMVVVAFIVVMILINRS